MITPFRFFASLTDVPCGDGAKFASRYRTMAEAWDACPRADWMLWAYGRFPSYGRDATNSADESSLRLFACWCARNTPLGDGRLLWDLIDDLRSVRAVGTAERFARGEASPDELYASHRAAVDAAGEVAQATTRAAERHVQEAAWYAALVVTCVATRCEAYVAARDATHAAVMASVYAVGVIAGPAARRAQADALRRHVPNPFSNASLT